MDKPKALVILAFGDLYYNPGRAQVVLTLLIACKCIRETEEYHSCHRILPKRVFCLGAELACETCSLISSYGKVYGKLCYCYLRLLKDIPTGWIGLFPLPIANPREYKSSLPGIVIFDLLIQISSNISIAVLPAVFFKFITLSPPASNRVFIIPLNSFCSFLRGSRRRLKFPIAALWSGVFPFRFFMATLAPRFKRNLTASTRSQCDASLCKHVLPLASVWNRFSLPVKSKLIVAASWGVPSSNRSHKNWNGVLPSRFWLLASAPLSSKYWKTTL